MNNYLIPANSKKSALILGIFKPVDFWILGIGCAVSLIFFVSIRTNDALWSIVIKLLPIALSVLLVIPIPYRHNVARLLLILIDYFFIDVQKEYKWRGWCASHEFGDKK